MQRQMIYSYDELVTFLGEPVFAGKRSGEDGAQALVFTCSCRSIRVYQGYEVGLPCEKHGAEQPIIKISDRRCGFTTLDSLDMNATGVLGMLITLQREATRNQEGCVDAQFGSELSPRIRMHWIV